MSSGLTRYFSGKACPKGHFAERLVSDRHCLVCSNESRDRRRLLNMQRHIQGVLRWQKANPEKVRATKALYRDNMRQHINAQHQYRRACKAMAVPAWFGEFDSFVMSEAQSLALMRKACTGIDWHVDHMIPLRADDACGLHIGNNMAVIPAFMNTSKCNSMIMTSPGAWLLHESNAVV